MAHLPDEADRHNHVGGPHAAMIFGLGETASGAVGLAAFGRLRAWRPRGGCLRRVARRTRTLRSELR